MNHIFILTFLCNFIVSIPFRLKFGFPLTARWSTSPCRELIKIYPTSILALNKFDEPRVANAHCPCGSGLNYADCCGKLHSFEASDYSAEQVARARYSAYALGLAQYVIDTCHHTQKDYVRHLDKSRDTRKAMKLWQKEIVTKNSDPYEYLLWEQLPLASPTSPEESPRPTGDDVHIRAENEVRVRFRVLIRGRADNVLYSFQETSTYMSAAPPPGPPLAPSPSSSKGGFGSSPSRSSAHQTQKQSRWLYVQGDVSAVSPEEVQAMSERVQTGYRTTDRIRDRW